MYTHKFIIPDNVRLFLTHEDYIILTEVGLPTQILAQTFVYNEEVLIKDDCVILGSNTHVSDWLLKVSLSDRSVFYAGKGMVSEEVYCFYNTNLKNLHLSLFSYNFFIHRLITTSLLGDYHLHYKKYANLLHDLIFDIDIQSTKEGVWCGLINEMKIGTF